MVDKPETIYDTDLIIQDALRTAANHVGSIPAEHNRDQAQAAILAFLREMIVAKRQTADFRSLIIAVRQSADCPDWWPPRQTLAGPPGRIVLSVKDQAAMTETTRRKPVYRLKAKPGELKAGWGRGDDDDGPDVSAAWQHPAQKGDMNLLLGWLGMLRPPGFDRSFTAELTARGYDLTTLKFTIQKKGAENAR